MSPFGALTKSAFADIKNALMAIPNLISLVVLSGVVVAETRTYFWRRDLEGTEN